MSSLNYRSEKDQRPIRKQNIPPLKQSGALAAAGNNIMGINYIDKELKSLKHDETGYNEGKQGNDISNSNTLNQSLILPIIHSNGANTKVAVISNPMMVIAKTIKSSSNPNNSPSPEKRSFNLPYRIDIDKQLPINLIYQSIQETLNTYKYYLGGGNNVEIVRKVMKTRDWWIQTSESQTMFVHFQWQQGNRGYKYDRLVENKNYRQCVNHFEFHECITNQQYLVQNLQSYCEKIHQNVFDVIPLTFILDLNSESCEPTLNHFIKVFEGNAPPQTKKVFTQSYISEFQRKMRNFIMPNGTDKEKHNSSTQYKIPSTFVATDTNSYMWLLKPTFLNRGRGIHLFNDLNALEKLINNYFYGYEEQAVIASVSSNINNSKSQCFNTISNNTNSCAPAASKDIPPMLSSGEKQNSSASFKSGTNHNTTQTLLQSQKTDNPPTLSTITSKIGEQKQTAEKIEKSPSVLEDDQKLSISSPSNNTIERKKTQNNEQKTGIITNSSLSPQKKQKDITSSKMSSANMSGVDIVNSSSNSNMINENIKAKVDHEFRMAAQQRGSSNSNYNSNDLKQIDFNKYMREMPTGPSILRATSFVLQKYIERPLLINKRKFDVRVWVLLTHELEIYFFPEGYIRTSSEEYNCDSKNLNNLFIHLTNNAIQKYSETYGAFQNGNQLSFSWFQRFLDSNMIQVDVRNDIVKKIQDIVFLSLQSVRKKINAYDRKFCFEIFGYDFFIDELMNVWLIEINTNPCIEESSKLLEMLIPRMLDDAFQLTLDMIFSQKSQHQSPNKNLNVSANNTEGKKEDIENIFKYLKPSSPEKVDNQKLTHFPVTGYSDDENMWEFIGSINENREISNMSPGYLNSKIRNQRR